VQERQAARQCSPIVERKIREAWLDFMEKKEDAYAALLADDFTWKPNPAQILFPNRRGTRPRSRDNVVRVGLKPVLKTLGIAGSDVGLHAFRHGLATELAEASVPLTVLQNQLRHADVKTTLRVYSHVIPQTQRDAMGAAGRNPIGTGMFNVSS
jgi:integrase